MPYAYRTNSQNIAYFYAFHRIINTAYRKGCHKKAIKLYVTVSLEFSRNGIFDSIIAYGKVTRGCVFQAF